MGAGAIAAATIGSAAIGAGTSIYAANKAASGADKAANLADARYQTTRGDLMPYNTAGQATLPALNALALSGPTGGGPDYVDLAYRNYLPGRMTQAELEQTPGYQFARDQGLKATQSAAAAKGLGVSGAALKGAASFATGLANQTYKDQFAIQQQRFTDVANLSPLQQSQLQGQYQRLQGTAALGESAAAQTGTTGATLTGLQANALNSAGLADAAGVKGVGNAVNSGVQNYLGYETLQEMIKRNGSNNPGAQTSNYNGIPVNSPRFSETGEYK